MEQKLVALETGFNAMGKPIPAERKEKAFILVQELGISDYDIAHHLVSKIVNLLERDKPFEAQAACLQSLCLTGTYRLIATLLT